MCLHGLHRGRWQGNDPVSGGNGEALEECTRISTKMRCRNKKNWCYIRNSNNGNKSLVQLCCI